MHRAEVINQEVKKKQSVIQQLQDQHSVLQDSLRELGKECESFKKADSEKKVGFIF